MNKIRLIVVLGMLFTQTACAAEQALSRAPAKAGNFDNGDLCKSLYGRYLPKGECLSGNCPLQSTLLDVLGTRYPPPGTPFNKGDERYVEIFFGANGNLNAKVVIGGFITSWEAGGSACDQGWLKLSRRSEGGAEGNDTRVDITIYLRKNTEGDLVVFQTVKGRTTNLFGLAQSNIDDQAWIVFKRK
ncbi:MAG: hypothetical protein Q7N95_01585 [Alphaproteobacteria bacterium]|nr:hypothetical protein [Alphaproteobacteria bacterium]